MATPTNCPPNLMAGLVREQGRVGQLLERYRSLGAPGHFGVVMIENVLARAEAAAASGEIPAIISAVVELQGWKD